MTKLVGSILFVAFLAGYLSIFYFLAGVPRTQVYDCRIAEISPDFPVEVREQCRKLNIQKKTLST